MFRILWAVAHPFLLLLGIWKLIELSQPTVSPLHTTPDVTDNSEPLLDSPPGPVDE